MWRSSCFKSILMVYRNKKDKVQQQQKNENSNKYHVQLSGAQRDDICIQCPLWPNILTPAGPSAFQGLQVIPNMNGLANSRHSRDSQQKGLQPVSTECKCKPLNLITHVEQGVNFHSSGCDNATRILAKGTTLYQIFWQRGKPYTTQSLRETFAHCSYLDGTQFWDSSALTQYSWWACWLHAWPVKRARWTVFKHFNGLQTWTLPYWSLYH